MIKAEELDTFLDFVGELVERNPVDGIPHTQPLFSIPISRWVDAVKSPLPFTLSLSHAHPRSRPR